MKVTPTGATPPMIMQTQNNFPNREKAMATLAGTPAQQPPIPVNANQVQPEEMGAIAPKMAQRQSDITEEVQEVTEQSQTPPKAEDSEQSRRFAQLARAERTMRAKAQEIKAKEDALIAREAELNGRKAPEVDMSQYISKSRFKEDPLGALADVGATYEELTERMINSQPIDPYVKQTINQLKAELQAMKDQQGEARKAQEQQQSEAYQAAVKQIETEAKKLVYTDPAFEMTKATNSTKDVVDLIERTFKEDGYLMTVEEAAQAVEQHLEEEITKLTRLEKIKRKMQTVAPKASSTPTQPPVETTKQPQPMKTLTNATSSTRQLSAKERAILAFKGEKF